MLSETQLMNKWEDQKKEIKNRNADVTMESPDSFIEYIYMKHPQKLKLLFNNSALKLKGKDVDTIFGDILTEICSFLASFVPEKQKFDYLFLCGGYSQSSIILKEIKDVLKAERRLFDNVVILPSIDDTIMKGMKSKHNYLKKNQKIHWN